MFQMFLCTSFLKDKLRESLNMTDSDPETLLQLSHVQTTPNSATFEVPYCGTVEVSPFDCETQFKAFCFHSFLTTKEVIITSRKVHEECRKVAELQLFSTQISKVCSKFSFYGKSSKFGNVRGKRDENHWTSFCLDPNLAITGGGAWKW